MPSLIKPHLFKVLLLLLLCLGTSVQAFPYCQAYQGSYAEPNSSSSLGEPAEVNVVLDYDVSLPQEHAVLDDAVMVDELTHRISDALVFTLFDHCRIMDLHDAASVVNMQRIDVQVTKQRTGLGYMATVHAVGDTAVGAAEMVLAQQRLTLAVRLSIQAHHVAKFTLEPGITLTLRDSNTAATSHDVPTTKTPPTSTTPTSVPTWLAVGAAAATSLLLAVSMMVLHATRTAHQLQQQQPSTSYDHVFQHDDDIELACPSGGDRGKKSSTKAPLLEECCDPTEVSESSSSEDDDAW